MAFRSADAMAEPAMKRKSSSTLSRGFSRLEAANDRRGLKVLFDPRGAPAVFFARGRTAFSSICGTSLSNATQVQR